VKKKYALTPQIEKLHDGMWVQILRGFRHKGYWLRKKRKMRVIDVSDGVCVVAIQRPLRTDEGYVSQALTFSHNKWKYCLIMTHESILANCKELPQDAS